MCRCDCGDTCCPSCGPAQGYEVVHVQRPSRHTRTNPESEGLADRVLDGLRAAHEHDGSLADWEGYALSLEAMARRVLRGNARAGL